MITNFEEITKELTEYDLKLIPFLIELLNQYTEQKPVTSEAIVKAMNQHFKGCFLIDGSKLRKCVNYIRSNGIIPVIATNKGYFVSYEPEQIQSQIKSLLERSRSIKNCADGLLKFTKN